MLTPESPCGRSWRPKLPGGPSVSVKGALGGRRLSAWLDFTRIPSSAASPLIWRPVPPAPLQEGSVDAMISRGCRLCKGQMTPKLNQKPRRLGSQVGGTWGGVRPQLGTGEDMCPQVRSPLQVWEGMGV